MLGYYSLLKSITIKSYALYRKHEVTVYIIIVSKIFQIFTKIMLAFLQCKNGQTGIYSTSEQLFFAYFANENLFGIFSISLLSVTFYSLFLREPILFSSPFSSRLILSLCLSKTIAENTIAIASAISLNVISLSPKVFLLTI